MRKKLIILLIVVLVAVIGFFIVKGIFIKDNSDLSDQSNSSQNVANDNNDNVIRLIAAGDYLPHDSVNANAETESGYDYLQFFDQVQPVYDSADLVFCNQESATTENIAVAGYPSFNAPIEFSRDINKLGCNLINLANNHLADYGTASIDGTLDTWSALNTKAVSGVAKNADQQKQINYFEEGGKKFALVSFTYLSNNTDVPDYALNMFSDGLVNELVGEANNNADFVIVSSHWGDEGTFTANDSQKEWANKLTAAGADLIIGTGPHTLQPVEEITSNGNTAEVWYSLGNLLSTQLKPDELLGGIAIIDIDVSGEKPKIISNNFLPTYMHYEWTAEEAASEDLLARKNLKIYPLDLAAEAIAKSQIGITQQEASDRVKQHINANNNINIINFDQFSSN